jgi:hypothetical protein
MVHRNKTRRRALGTYRQALHVLHFTATVVGAVMELGSGVPPIVIATGLAPENALAGICRLIWKKPETNPGAAPA